MHSRISHPRLESHYSLNRSFDRTLHFCVCGKGWIRAPVAAWALALASLPASAWMAPSASASYSSSIDLLIESLTSMPLPYRLVWELSFAATSFASSVLFRSSGTESSSTPFIALAVLVLIAHHHDDVSNSM